MARISSIAISGMRRPWITCMPSSSGKMASVRDSNRSRSACASSCRRPFFHARTMRSSCAVVAPRASSSSSASVSPLATRVNARTCENDSSPRDIAAPVNGSDSSARAARTFSRAAPRSIPVRNASQCAQVR
jgi:hypothetical protein